MKLTISQEGMDPITIKTYNSKKIKSIEGTSASSTSKIPPITCRQGNNFKSKIKDEIIKAFKTGEIPVYDFIIKEFIDEMKNKKLITTGGEEKIEMSCEDDPHFEPDDTIWRVSLYTPYILNLKTIDSIIEPAKESTAEFLNHIKNHPIRPISENLRNKVIDYKFKLEKYFKDNTPKMNKTIETINTYTKQPLYIPNLKFEDFTGYSWSDYICYSGDSKSWSYSDKYFLKEYKEHKKIFDNSDPLCLLMSFITYNLNVGGECLLTTMTFKPKGQDFGDAPDEYKNPLTLPYRLIYTRYISKNCDYRYYKGYKGLAYFYIEP